MAAAEAKEERGGGGRKTRTDSDMGREIVEKAEVIIKNTKHSSK